MKKKGFTLLEILLSITGFFLLMTIVINAYLGIITFRYSFQARAKLLETTYYMFERVNLLLRDYTIDYEEYFNRSRVGCDTLSSFSWNVGINGYCDLFTTFGNKNTFKTNTGQHALYHCSSSTGYSTGFEYVIETPNLLTGCATGTHQSFGQYALQFLDVKDNSDFNFSAINDSDDIDLGKGPDAVLQATGVKELYLISQDKQYRVFIRRALIESGDWNGDGQISGDNEFLYALQMLKLRSFDAGNNHDFVVATSSGVYDGVLDTWTCDYSQGFVCGGNALGNIYSGYRLPLSAQDVLTGWVDLFDRSITVTDRNITIYPTKNPNLSWAEGEFQIAPYFTISLKTKLYAGLWQKKLKGSIQNYQFTLQTTFSTKNNY
ncbi:hypothetical protein P148_SR1C00001G0526 [candidate division SR1 bacterium RAAC1_SR1_1]|nr:hypothetical protein P148_SR1C00001G0526 [candidate division SR1 bacterium RAAC1_SR1_1]